MPMPMPTRATTTRLAPRVARLDLGRRRRRHLFRRRLDVAHRSTADSDSEYSILRPLAARDDARFRDCNRTSHSSLTRRLHLTIRASRRPRRLGARALSQKTPQSPRARSVVTTARARRPSSCRAKRARGNLCRMAIAVRARRRGWYARALPTTTNHSRCVRSTGNFKSERLGRTSARWRRSRDDERRTKTSW